MQSLFDEDKTVAGPAPAFDEKREEEPVILAAFTPPSASETMRRTGLAWSAGIAFFGAIAFMLFLGWIADLLLGSSPWGLVGGIVLGSTIGFLQFFRISSRIFGKTETSPSEHPLMAAVEEHNVRTDRFDRP